MLTPLSELTLTQLALEHDALTRWLNIPCAELWVEEHAQNTQRIKAVWAEMQRRKAEDAPSVDWTDEVRSIPVLKPITTKVVEYNPDRKVA